MNTCIFCGAEVAVNLGTARASCNPCHDFVFSDVETTHLAFRLGALMAARVNVTGDLVREIAREALGFKAPKTLPVGTLKERHWRALCRAYVRGEQGMGYHTDTGDGFGYMSWKTCIQPEHRQGRSFPFGW